MLCRKGSGRGRGHRDVNKQCNKIIHKRKVFQINQYNYFVFFWNSRNNIDKDLKSRQFIDQQKRTKYVLITSASGHDDDTLHALAELGHGEDDRRCFQRPQCPLDVLLEGRDAVVSPRASLGIDVSPSPPKKNSSKGLGLASSKARSPSPGIARPSSWGSRRSRALSGWRPSSAGRHLLPYRQIWPSSMEWFRPPGRCRRPRYWPSCGWRLSR